MKIPYKDPLVAKQKAHERYLKVRDSSEYRNPDGSWKKGVVDKEVSKQRHRAWYLKNRERTNEEKRLERLARRQQSFGSCKICFKETYLDYDHCHLSNEFRGYICRNCNLALGHAFDNQQTLYNMIQYLRDFNDRR